MKKTILLLLVCTSYYYSTAQIKKGSLLVGGQISVFNSNINNNNFEAKNNGAGLTISIGKAIKNNQVFGGYIGFSNNNTENINNGVITSESKNNSYNAGVFYRHYTTLAKQFYFFGEVNGGFSAFNQTQKNSGNNSVTTTKGNGVNIGVTPGLSYQIYKKLQLELLVPSLVSLGYSNSTSTFQNNTNKNSSFNFNTNLSGSLFNNLGLGFRLVL